jgi:hypothetical protein
MRADRSPTTPSTLAACVIACLAIVLALPTGTYATVTTAASNRCVSYVREAPCLGPIQVLYPMFGRDGGALHSLPAKLGPEEEVGKEPNGYPIIHRTLSWHTAAGIKLVVAYELTPTVKNGDAAFHFHRIPTGTHSGHIVLTGTTNVSTHIPERDPMILLEAERTVADAGSS